MEPVCENCAQRQEPVVLKARILRVSPCELLVCDLCGCQEVVVHTDNACCFRPGQCVCVEYDGAMTMSIPPQVSADCVKLIPCPYGGCTC